MFEYVLTVILTVVVVVSLLVGLIAHKVAILWHDFQRRGLERSPPSNLSTSRKWRKYQDFVARHMSGLLETTRATLSKGKPTISQVKRDVIIKSSLRTFYYFDKTQVKDLYLEVFQELELKEIETEEVETTKKGIEATLVVKPKYEKVKSVRIKKKYEITPVTMYNKLEKYFFGQKHITFAVEDFDYDESPIDDFRSMCSQMQKQLNFFIPDHLQNNFISDKMRSLALEAIKRLSQASGYVAILAEFATSSVTEDSCILDFDHPLNKHLNPDDIQVHLQIICDTDSLTPTGKKFFNVGNSMKITSIGKVANWDTKRRVLLINPLAIYF